MLVSLLIAVIVIGLAYWLVMRLPFTAPFGMIAQVLIIIIALWYLLRFLPLS